MFRAMWLTIAICVILVVACSIALAVDRDGLGMRVSQSQKDFIKNLKNHNGIPCCDDADGFTPPDWGILDDGSGYYVVVDGVRVTVPPEAVITPNLLGEARVWYVLQNGMPHIRCFLPGSGV
jgi:hypothetical protein